MVKDIAKHVKFKKSSAIGGVNPELIKYRPDILFETLAKLFDRCVNGDELKNFV